MVPSLPRDASFCSIPRGLQLCHFGGHCSGSSPGRGPGTTVPLSRPALCCCDTLGLGVSASEGFVPYPKAALVRETQSCAQTADSPGERHTGMWHKGMGTHGGDGLTPDCVSGLRAGGCPPIPCPHHRSSCTGCVSAASQPSRQTQNPHPGCQQKAILQGLPGERAGSELLPGGSSVPCLLLSTLLFTPSKIWFFVRRGQASLWAGIICIN